MSGFSDDDYQAVGEVLGEALKRVDERLAPLEEEVAALAQERQRLVLQVREHRMDTDEEIRDVRNEMAALKAKLTLLHACVSPKDSIKVNDAISMLRSVK